MDHACLSSTSHRCLVGLRSGEYGGQVNTSNSIPQIIPEPFLLSGRSPADRGRWYMSK